MLQFSGLGPAAPSTDLWRLTAGAWSRVPVVGSAWPRERVGGALVWNPAANAFMVFGGILADDDGKKGLSDTWFFRTGPPSAPDAAVSPAHPAPTEAVKVALGKIKDGYGRLWLEVEWYVNGVRVSGAGGEKLNPGPYEKDDEIHARIRLADELGMLGPWVQTATVVVGSKGGGGGGGPIRR
jgi:hypothetical protein